MNYRVLHLSLALLTLAPSLDAADGSKNGGPGKRKKTFAQATQATSGLAGILPLSDDLEAAKAAKINNPTVPCVTPAQAQGLLQAAKAMLAEAITGTPQTLDLPFPEEATTPVPTVAKPITKEPTQKEQAIVALVAAEPAPKRSEEEFPQIDQLLAAADQSNTYVRWATLQQELATINTKLAALQDPNVAQIERTQAQAELEQRIKTVTTEIASLESAPTPYVAYTGPRRPNQPDQAEITEATERKTIKIPPTLIRELNLRIGRRSIENVQAKINKNTLRDRQQELEKAWQRHQVERDTKNNTLWMKYAASILQCNPTPASIANALTQHHPTFFGSPKKVESAEALQVFEQFLTGPLAGMFSPAKEDRANYHRQLQKTRDVTRNSEELLAIKERRPALLGAIKHEQEHHGMPASTWGDTWSSLSLW